jgi:hypothetical protein
MKWGKSEVAPKICALLHNGDALIGMVVYDKFAHTERWRAVVTPSYNTIGRGQTKREAMRLVEAHYEKVTSEPFP